MKQGKHCLLTSSILRIRDGRLARKNVSETPTLLEDKRAGYAHGEWFDSKASDPPEVGHISRANRACPALRAHSHTTRADASIIRPMDYQRIDPLHSLFPNRRQKENRAAAVQRQIPVASCSIPVARREPLALMQEGERLKQNHLYCDLPREALAAHHHGLAAGSAAPSASRWSGSQRRFERPPKSTGSLSKKTPPACLAGGRLRPIPEVSLEEGAAPKLPSHSAAAGFLTEAFPACDSRAKQAKCSTPA